MIMSNTSSDAVVIERTLDAPPSTVWAMWTTSPRAQ